MTTPTRFPSAFTRCTVRCRLLLPSQWTRNESEPASVNSSRKKSGSEIIKWVSNGKRVTRRSDSTIGAPIEMLGTKCPSMTSTWMRSAPACSASPTCLPKWAKSAARIEGASFTSRLSISRFLPFSFIHHEGPKCDKAATTARGQDHHEAHEACPEQGRRDHERSEERRVGK